MEYQQNLSGHFIKSKVRIIFGILSMLFAIGLITGKIYERHATEVYDWIFAFLLVLNGFMHIAGGKGYILEDFLGRKSFVRIDEEQIRIRTISKERQFNWNDISIIEYKNGYLRITKENRSPVLIRVDNIDSTQLAPILSTMKEIAAKKNIEFDGKMFT